MFNGRDKLTAIVKGFWTPSPKLSLAIQAKTMGHFFPLFIKSNLALRKNCLVSQVVIGNFRLLVSRVRRQLSDFVNIVTV